MEGTQMKKVLTAVLLELEKNNIPYALVGALAFAFWGHRRYTEDIDFLVRKDDIDRVKEIMQRYCRILGMEEYSEKIRKFTE